MPAVEPGRITQARVRASPLSPVVGQSDFARLGRLTALLPHFDPRQTLVPGIEAEPPQTLRWWPRLSAVESTLARWSLGRGKSNLRTQTKGQQPQISHLSVKSHSGIASDPSLQPRVGSQVSPRMDTHPRGLVDSWAPNTPPC